MGDPVQITVDRAVLVSMQDQARGILEPSGKYNPNNETYLKSVIAEQRDRAGVINTLLSNILYQ